MTQYCLHQVSSRPIKGESPPHLSLFNEIWSVCVTPLWSHRWQARGQKEAWCSGFGKYPPPKKTHTFTHTHTHTHLPLAPIWWKGIKRGAWIRDYWRMHVHAQAHTHFNPGALAAIIEKKCHPLLCRHAANVLLFCSASTTVSIQICRY